MRIHAKWLWFLFSFFLHSLLHVTTTPWSVMCDNLPLLFNAVWYSTVRVILFFFTFPVSKEWKETQNKINKITFYYPHQSSNSIFRWPLNPHLMFPVTVKVSVNTLSYPRLDKISGMRPLSWSRFSPELIRKSMCSSGVTDREEKKEAWTDHPLGSSSGLLLLPAFYWIMPTAFPVDSAVDSGSPNRPYLCLGDHVGFFLSSHIHWLLCSTTLAMSLSTWRSFQPQMPMTVFSLCHEGQHLTSITTLLFCFHN